MNDPKQLSMYLYLIADFDLEIGSYELLLSIMGNHGKMRAYLQGTHCALRERN